MRWLNPLLFWASSSNCRSDSTHWIATFRFSTTTVSPSFTTCMQKYFYIQEMLFLLKQISQDSAAYNTVYFICWLICFIFGLFAADGLLMDCNILVSLYFPLALEFLCPVSYCLHQVAVFRLQVTTVTSTLVQISLQILKPGTETK